MKRSNQTRQFLGRWMSQSLVLGPLVFLMVAGAGCPSLFESEGQRAVHIRQALVGKDGDRTITAPNTIVNSYAALYAGVNHGNNKITVRPTEDATFASGLANGDLLLIIQMAGAAMDSTNTVTYGTVSAANLGNAGHYEFASVESVTANEITLTCLLKNDYTGPTGKTQVIRVPQYKTLTIQSANNASITAPAWDGTVGGVVAVHAETTLVLNGKIDVTAKGFRGGATDDATGSSSVYRSGLDTDGAEKGESIVGYAAEYESLGGRFGRGAPANGGGGGDAHNSGGGGGANARHGVTWTGQGVMSTTVTGGASAWPLDPNYAGRDSEGGGRGGYSYSSSTTADPTVSAPGDATWGGDDRRQVGGLGGHPVDNSPASRLFMGGGGGAGDGNNGVAGRGGNGGGLVFIIAGAISGTGSIVANGEAGANAVDSAAGGDAAGGGGGGGTVVVHAVSVTGISVTADGGLGGLQTGTRTDTEGPGGGGGGGYIAVAGGTVSLSAKGALGGTTAHAVMAKFPSNGATAGNDGQTNGDASGFLYCGMNPAANTPDTTIVTYPADPSGSPRGTFTFSSTEGAVTYQCQIDGQTEAGWGDCGTPYTTAALPDGEHTLYVRAIDLSGNKDSSPASRTWTIIAGELDGGVLNTTILTSPPKVSGNPAGTFTFTSNHPPVTYECRLDSTSDAAWATCTTPFGTGVLPDGSHTFEVRAIDANGTRDSSPASWTWTIVAGELDGGVLDTTIVTSPPKLSGDPVATFTFSSNHPPATYQCRVDSTDDAAWATCDTPFSTGALPDGAHTFEVRAIDVNGTRDTSPASWTWTIVASRLDGGSLDAGTIDASGLDVSAKDDVGKADSPIVFAPDVAPQLDAGLDGPTGTLLDSAKALDAGDALVAVLDGAADGSADADTAPPTKQDAAIIAQADAAAAGNKDAAATEQKPVLLGGGFCAVSSSRASSPAAFALLALAGLALLRRRRSR